MRELCQFGGLPVQFSGRLVNPAVSDDRIHCHTGVRPAAGTTAAATDDLPQLVAEHSTADSIQKEVDGEAGDVQCLAVVADDRQSTPRHVDEFPELDLAHDKVQQDWDVGEHVAG